MVQVLMAMCFYCTLKLQVMFHIHSKPKSVNDQARVGVLYSEEQKKSSGINEGVPKGERAVGNECER